jgi:enterochelin esterase-like enzyme
VRRALIPALAGIALLAPARPAALPASWTIADQGARGGVTYGGVPVDGVGAVYIPARVQPGQRLRVAYLIAGGHGDPGLARELGIAEIGDQLSWQRTTPPFAVVVTSGHGSLALARAMHFAGQALPLSRVAAGRVVVGFGVHAPAALQAVLQPRLRVGTGIAIGGRMSRRLIRRLERADRRLSTGRMRIYRAASTGRANTVTLWRRQLLAALSYAFATPAVDRASQAAGDVAPLGWTRIATGPYGGTVWQGLVPNRADPGHARASLVYLPPGVRRSLRYPALYLLHGLRGSPYSFVGGLRLAAVADSLIHARRVRPFVAVMPPAGSTPRFDGEWTGTWERYVVQDIVPWADRHLPLAAARGARTLAGFSAGAYGSVDIALRHPALFGTVESWSGYFRAPRDGSLAHATRAERLAHDPLTLVSAEAAGLRAAHVRFFLSAGRRERRTLSAARAFALELSGLGLEHVLRVTGGGHHGRAWRAVLPVGLRYALELVSR